MSKRYLYHATYAPLLESIKKHGLDTKKGKKSWEDSIPGYVYLAKTKEVAISYAETSDAVSEEWLDQIVVLKIDIEKIDSGKLYVDANAIDGDTLEYRGIIPFNSIVGIL